MQHQALGWFHQHSDAPHDRPGDAAANGREHEAEMTLYSAGSTDPPRIFTVHANGLDLACVEWPGKGRPIFFVHATGFHARCWDQVIAQLPGRHCYAVDLRGHGRSAKPPPPYSWLEMGIDVAEVAAALNLRDALGVGHSGGGYAVTVAAARVPDGFAALLLVDPSILAHERYGQHVGQATTSFVLKRRNRWSSPYEMAAHFQDRHPYRLWQPAALHDYCTYGLLPSTDGEGYVLACPPEVEAAVYAGTARDDPYDLIHSLNLPVRVLRARQRGTAPPGAAVDMSFSPTTPDLATHFLCGEDILLPELSHYIPMEAPALVAQHIAQLGW